MSERVLVTGAAGYLGSVICEELLAKGYRVRAVDNLMFNQHTLFHLCHRPEFEFTCGDVRDERVMVEALRDVDHIIPLAAIVGAKACEKDRAATKAINVDSVQMLNRLRSSSQQVLMPITNSGYGTKSGEVYCTEDTPLEPITLYGQTKVEAERILLDSPNVVTLRLATVFGMSPKMRLDLLVNHFVYAALTDGYIVLFEQDFKRNYIHIRDIADCFMHSIENFDAMKGRPYNVGLDDANLSKAELAEEVKKFVPNFYIHYGEIGEDPDKRNYIVSNQRLREAGFEAKRSIGVGIEELLKGYSMLGRAQFKNA
ncbi:MAG: NAD(P)-dependent oxidoreductase [Myxococcota bacterium]|nr:NAD(P)-dependent oxidoreductase [Myxococcota bacterium]